MSQITFKKKGSILSGRHCITQTGVNIYPEKRLDDDNQSYDILCLTALNSRGEFSQVEIQIPFEDLDEFIKHLEYFKNDQPKHITNT